MMNSLLLGTHVFPATGDTKRRLNLAFDSWRELDVPLVDLAFNDTPPANEHQFFEYRCLKRDSNTVCNCQGIRKPLVSDLFDGLCSRAKEIGCRYFVFSNADIQLTRQFKDLIAHTDLDAFIFTRHDYTSEPSEGDAKLFYRGQDTYAVRTQWWIDNRQHFQPYIIGESLWDNVYTAKFARKGRSELAYLKNVCLHQRHAQQWNPRSPFGRYNEMLRLRYDYLDYGMWASYARKLYSMDRDSAGFSAHQKRIWDEFSMKGPSAWLKVKRPIAYALSFAT